MITTARNATLEDLAAILSDQHARKLDVVAPASTIRASGGNLVLRGTEPIIDESGVTEADGSYTPTAVCDEGLSDKLGIPVAYLRRMREERPDLFDGNVNGWLHGRKRNRVASAEEWRATGEQTVQEVVYPGDDRSFLVRCFRGDDGSPGVARAFLSRNFRMIDHLDVLTAALDGVRETGTEVRIEGCDLTERRMRVRVTAPEVQAYAPTLLAGYRSPFSGATAEENPVVWAGFEIGNSETGGAAFTITPRLVVEVCRNGMTIAKDALRAVHLGGKLDDGVIRWSQDTQDHKLRLTTKMARDAVATFLDVDYVTGVLVDVERKAGREVTKPQETIETVCRQLRFPAEYTEGVLAHFVRSGQTTAGGVMSAVTAFAQTLDDGDAAADLEASALRVLEVAAS